MRALFSAKGISLVWIILTASAGLNSALRDLAAAIRAAHPERYLVTWFNSLNTFPAQALQKIYDLIQFRPNVQIRVGSQTIVTDLIPLAIGAVILVGVVWLHRRATKSPTFADDLVTLGLLYLGLQITAGLWFGTSNRLVQLRTGLVAPLITALILFQMDRAGARDDTKVFFKGLLQIYVVCAFLVPSDTITATTNFIETLATIGQALSPSPIFAFWCAAGMILALYLIYGLGVKPGKPTAEVLDALKKKVEEDFDKAKKSA
jgi:hypothetical protein